MAAKTGDHLGTFIEGRRVILSETLVLREGDNEVKTAVQGVIQVTFRFKARSGKTAIVDVTMQGSNEIILEIDDGDERGGFTHWTSFTNDAGPDLVVALFVDPIGPVKRTRQFSYTLSLGPE